MDLSIDDDIVELESAWGEFDHAKVAEIGAKLAERIERKGEVPSMGDAARLLKAFRRTRELGTVQALADALFKNGRSEAIVRKHYGQCLIEKGDFTTAALVLEPLASSLARDDGEWAEVVGLLGRARKQDYVTGSGSPKALRDAVKWYSAGYEASPGKNLWHGINLVACLVRAERDGIEIADAADPRPLAEKILAHVDPEGPAWDLATATEACVALDREGEAETWLFRYMQKEYDNAFAFGATLRQFDEVWQLDAHSAFGRRLMIPLRAKVASLSGGEVLQMAGEVFEGVHGVDARFVNLQWWSNGIERAKAVGRIDDVNGEGLGTGFLVDGASLCPDLTGRTLFLTNAHVVSDDPAVHARTDLERPPLLSRDAFVSFQVDKNRRESSPVELIRESPPDAFDTTLLALKRDNIGLPRLEARDQHPRAPNQHVWIIGYPGGHDLRFSTQDNRVVRADEKNLIYRTPTKPGNSGSPVFDRDWHLVAIHHKEVSDGNEGILMKAIRQWMGGKA